MHDIYDTLGLVYAATKQKLSGYFSPKKNVQYHVYVFRKSIQEPGENLDSYHTRLRMMAKNCEFADFDAEIKTQIIQSCASSRLRRKTLREPDLTLVLLLDHGRTLELSEMQASGIEKGTAASVNALDQKIIKRAAEGLKNIPFPTINAGTVEVNILMMVNALLKIKNVEPGVN